MSNELSVNNQSNAVSIFFDPESFERAQRIALMMCKSDFVPKAFQGNDKIPNILIALDVATRMNAQPFMVMQNLNIIQGRPSFSTAFLVGQINSSGRFTPLEYEVERLGQKTLEYDHTSGYKESRKTVKKTATYDEVRVTAFATDLATGRVLKGSPFTLEMAYRSGLFDKADSKWPIEPESMAKKRAATRWANEFAPELALGMPTTESLQDAPEVETVDAVIIPTANPNEKLRKAEPVAEPVPTKEPEPSDDEPLFEDVEHEPSDGTDIGNDNDGGLFDDDDKPEI